MGRKQRHFVEETTVLQEDTSPGEAACSAPIGAGGTATIAVHPLMTAAQVARVLNIGERTVWRLVSRAQGGAAAFPKPVRIGGRAVRWRWQDVQKYLGELAAK